MDGYKVAHKGENPTLFYCIHDLDKNDVKFKNRSIFEKVRENAKPVRDPLFRLITKHNLKKCNTVLLINTDSFTVCIACWSN